MSYIATIKHSNPERYGVIIKQGDMLKRIVEKPKSFVGNLINTGLYKFTPDIFDALRVIKKSERGEYELTDAVTMIARKRSVKVIELRDFWLELGSISDIKAIEGFLSGSNAKRNKGSD